MTESGLRERKKLRTRRALVDSALRLFQQKGYDGTTVAEIAAAADVSTKTFFNYFAGKEEVVFADSRRRIELALQVIAERRPGEGPAALLTRLLDRILALIASPDSDIDPAYGPTRIRLVMSHPNLQARTLHMLFEMQHQLAAALREVYPGLDRVDAAAVVGAWMGAVQAAALNSTERGEDFDQVCAATRRAADVAARGIGSLDGADIRDVDIDDANVRVDAASRSDGRGDRTA